ncbi:hypothetical protein SAMN02746089_02803, partial [Caldanaerobius fijiensis DSM 17918]
STAQVNYGQGTGANWGKPSYGGFDRLQKYGYNTHWNLTTDDPTPFTAIWGWDAVYGFVDSVMSRAEQFPPSGPTQPIDLGYEVYDPNGYKILNIAGIGNIAEVTYQYNVYGVNAGRRQPATGYDTRSRTIMLVKQDGKWKVAAYVGEGWLNNIIPTL